MRYSTALIVVNTLLILSALASSEGATAACCADQPARGERESRNICGWKVLIDRRLLDKERAATERALGLVKVQLEEIGRVVPQPALTMLQTVPLYFSPEYPGVPPRAEYHPGAGWLREHGRDPAMEKSVEFTNVRIFEAEAKRMPMLVLHELAHAYHHQVLGNDHAAILVAYKNAKASGKYDRVERHDANGKSSWERAYAMTNPQEYFAETTEAFFGVNDFFPFTRRDLEKADPAMAALLEKLWTSPPAKTGKQMS